MSYLQKNKLDLLRSGVYSPESYLQEEQRLNTELISLQDHDDVSNASLPAVIKDVLILSELLKTGSSYYEFANSDEKAEIVKIVFAELSLSDSTLQYKVRNGFKALESRFASVCERERTRTSNPCGTSS